MRISDFLKNTGATSLLITTHVNADPDALASALLLEFIIQKKYGLETTIIFPQGLNMLSKRIVEDLGIEVPEKELGEIRFDAILLVDTSTSELLDSIMEKIKTLKTPIGIIDHHLPPGDLAKISVFNIIKKEVATTALILQLDEALSLKLPSKLSTLAITGILYDSGRFSRASSTSLKVVARLIDEGGDYDRAVKLLSVPEEKEDLPSRMAKLKGAQRAMLIKMGSHLIAITHVSSHEAPVARALIPLGADVAFVIGGKEELRISSRAREGFVRKTGIDLGELMRELEKYLEGKGGGHSTAGGFNGKGDPQRAIRAIVNLLEERLT